MALRRGFTRYAFSIQYHGSSFLGFPYLSDRENAVIEHTQPKNADTYTHTTDLRGYRSIESRLRQALKDMVGSTFENIQVSSRTDRGVHALKNTCQVDIGHRQSTKGEPTKLWQPEVLLRGLNHHLSQQGVEYNVRHDSNNSHPNTSHLSNQERRIQQRAKRKIDAWSFHYPMNELRILNILQAPLTIPNDYHTIDPSQPATVDWNIRFSAKQRTYIYRILACPRDVADWALPFEWDRSWRVVPLKKKQQSLARKVLDVDAMAEAAKYFLGTHDFSSFRAAGCQRKVPVVTMQDIQIRAQPYGEPLFWEARGGLLGLGGGSDDNKNNQPQLITIKIVGNSFVYNQVRNMVGALVAVGRGSLEPLDIKRILAAKDRTLAPPLAPAHGLFLANVRHDDIAL